MDNNGMKFDPMTGKPLEQTTNTNNTPNTNGTNNLNNVQNINNMNTTQNINTTNATMPNGQVLNGITGSVSPTVQPNLVDTSVVQNIQSQSNMVNQINQMQSIPTVDQSREAFIDNTQSMTAEKNEAKKSSVNYVFVIILFIIIFASIFFLFPFLFKNL